MPRQQHLEPADKWNLLHQSSLGVPALDDIVTKILNDDGADVEQPMAALIGHETGDVMLHADQWDHTELSDISAKSQSCTSDVFSFDGYEYCCCCRYMISTLTLSYLMFHTDFVSIASCHYLISRAGVSFRFFKFQIFKSIHSVLINYC